ncbi:MAG: hypothetical protein MI919_24770 [Holophagales bacterium]|nr:hypothetical protein [Holophagales bacterium]
MRRSVRLASLTDSARSASARARCSGCLARAHRALSVRLEQRQEELRLLGALVPICASCKRVRSDEGYWREVETFIASEYGARLSHGMCPDCLADALSEL